MVYPAKHRVRVKDGDGFKEREVPRIRRYVENDPDDSKIYDVFIQKISSEQQMNQVKLAKKIFDKYDTNVSMLFVTNKKMKVTCNSAKIANEIASSEEWLIDYNVTIVYSKAEVKGKISIPSEYSEKEIYENLIPLVDKSVPMNTAVLEVIRIPRKKVEAKEQRKNSETVIVTFEGCFIPKYVKFEYLLIPVEPYIERILQCQNCWAYSHSTKACRGRKRCVGCGDKELHVTCSEVKCVNCHGPHKANSNLCPIMTEKREKNKAKAFSTIRSEIPEAINPYIVFGEESFPPLNPIAKDNQKSQENQQSLDNSTPMDESVTRKRRSTSVVDEETTYDNLIVVQTKFAKNITDKEPWDEDIVTTLELDAKGENSLIIPTYSNERIGITSMGSEDPLQI